MPNPFGGMGNMGNIMKQAQKMMEQAKKTEEWAHAFIEAINKNGDLTSVFMKQVVAEMLRQGKTIEDIQRELNKLR